MRLLSPCQKCLGKLVKGSSWFPNLIESSLESSSSSPLTPHLVLEPDDERGLDHEFYTEMIAHFSEDEALQPAVVAAVEELSQQLARKSMNDNYRPHVAVSTL